MHAVYFGYKNKIHRTGVSAKKLQLINNCADMKL